MKIKFFKLVLFSYLLKKIKKNLLPLLKHFNILLNRIYFWKQY